MIIHLNYTVIRGMNDEPSEMEKVIEFATRVGGEAKFIDLASRNQELIVSCEEIEQNLNLLGFKKVDGNKWQSFFVRHYYKVRLF